MKTHEFHPTHYHRTFGPHEPVLRIASGDRVVTRTVDAGGFDADDRHVTARGNPLTGPFWVDGAEPGDQVTVHVESVVPNRTRGFSRASLAPNVLDPAFAVETASEYVSEHAEWAVDVSRGVAKLVEPETALGRIELELAPMLGCIGVAPTRGQAISTATSAEHGGNMDYRKLTGGVTLHFPVFEPGALLFVGDAHALQGDGEISGTGIEISADVRFTVELRKGHTLDWPRGVTEAELFTLGNARPLDQALQHATSEMMRWLTREHGLDATGASLLLSQCVRYEVANVFDPAYTVACKLPRTVVERAAARPHPSRSSP